MFGAVQHFTDRVHQNAGSLSQAEHIVLGPPSLHAKSPYRVRAVCARSEVIDFPLNDE